MTLANEIKSDSVSKICSTDRGGTQDLSGLNASSGQAG